MPSLTKLHVAELRVGMYVAKLDRDWLDTPFIMQGFQIEDEEDIDIVSEYCEFVWVDTAPMKGSQYSSSAGTARSAPSRAYQPQVEIQEEQKKIVNAFRAARSETKNMLNNLRLGDAINTEQAKETVSECVQSVIRHPDALLWMARIRDEREYTAEHSLNVCILAIAFGRQLGLDEKDLEKLGLCGLLHDVGKMRVPIEILDKQGPLTDKEMRMMKAHTVHGRNLLMSTPSIYAGAIDTAYSHHEKMDGTGYPRKIPGTGVSFFTRIIAIVDAYDAMTADRCYSRAKTSTEALKVIYESRGTHFDEQLSLKFIQTIGLYPPGSIVELYTGEVGIVLESNQNFRHLPRVILVLDTEKKQREKERLIDLGQVESGELPRRYLIKQVWRDGSFGISLREYQKRGLVLKF